MNHGSAAGPRRRLVGGVAVALAALCAGVAPENCLAATGIVNPHDTTKPRFCLNCHTEEIYNRSCGESEGYCLLGGSVDGICLTCHIKEECCKPGLEHLRKLYLGKKSHPSDVDAATMPRQYAPTTLPLHNGRITCRTCHLHVQQKPEGYKMLRLVRISSRGVDWSVLCQDCHKER